jgi:hypothetical protein
MHDSTTFHPVQSCYDGIFNSASGKQISLKNPTSDQIDIRDIAGPLSKICRFGGHISTFYSVAQHSVLVASLAPDPLKKAALLHDAAEAYLGDVIKPLKVMIGPAYEALETEFNYAISARFNIDLVHTYEQIKQYDLQALELEFEALQKGNLQPLLSVFNEHGMLLFDHWAWDHKMAKTAFIALYHDLFNL